MPEEAKMIMETEEVPLFESVKQVLDQINELKEIV
jgi:hypothetical protein